MTKSATREAADEVSAPIASPVFTGDATVSTGNLVIGTNGKGIDFSANADSSATGASTTSELLDDYEEGTWTPAYTVGSSGYSNQVGKYTKIGEQVTAYFYLQMNNNQVGGSTLHVGGLPFTCNSNSSYGAASGFTAIVGQQVPKNLIMDLLLQTIQSLIYTTHKVLQQQLNQWVMILGMEV